MSRTRARGVRRGWQRLRRRLRPLNLAAIALVVISGVVVVNALRGPPIRASSFRTDPVLRAMGLPDEEPTADLAALTQVPSLSASPRFVLPLVRDEHKRVLAALQPLPPPVPSQAPIVLARPVLPEVAPPPAAPAPVLAAKAAPEGEPKPPARYVVAKSPVAVAPLTTALTITPVLPRRESLRPGKAAMLAIVLDDMGPPPTLTRRAIQLPVPVTLSFLPYAEDLPATTAAARAHGHEVFLHLPMEPIGSADPGPNAIFVGLDPNEFNRRLSWAFERVPLATGLNNHMGSRATSEPESMLKVLQEVRRRGLNFVDSRTSPLSVGDGLAAQLGIPHAARDVFLDNNPAPAAILRQLDEAERLARRRGHALAIGHPYPTTLSVLESWLPAAEARGLKIVRASDLIAATSCDQPAPLQVNACNGPDCPPAPDC
ncbi:MAG: divergent polysaccharide deacetylase family protein [Geminicoccaceae bacterium]